MIQQPEDSYLIGVFIKLDAESYKKKIILFSLQCLQVFSAIPSPFLHEILNNNLIITIIGP